MNRRVWVLPGTAMATLMSLKIIDFQQMTSSIALLSGPSSCASLHLFGDLALKTSPVKFSVQLHILQNRQRIRTSISTQIWSLCCSISGKQRFTLNQKKKKKKETWRGLEGKQWIVDAREPSMQRSSARFRETSLHLSSICCCNNGYSTESSARRHFGVATYRAAICPISGKESLSFHRNGSCKLITVMWGWGFLAGLCF